MVLTVGSDGDPDRDFDSHRIHPVEAFELDLHPAFDPERDTDTGSYPGPDRQKHNFSFH